MTLSEKTYLFDKHFELAVVVNNQCIGRVEYLVGVESNWDLNESTLDCKEDAMMMSASLLRLLNCS